MEVCGDMGVLARCEELHMMNTGASEPDKELIEIHRKVLKAVLQYWVDDPKRRDYDDAVKNLVRIAITENNWLNT